MAASDGTDVLALYSINNTLKAVANGQLVTLPFTHNNASIKKVNTYEYDITFSQKLTVKTQFYGRLDLTVVVPTTVPGFSMVGGLCGTTTGSWVFQNASSYTGAIYDSNQAFLSSYGESCKFIIFYLLQVFF